MACNCSLITGGIAKSCDFNTGGIEKIYLTDHCNITSYTEANSEITAISLESTTQFWEYEFNRNTSSYEEVTNINIENGSTFYTQTVSLILSRRDKTKAEKIKELATGQKKLWIIVKDSNGLYWAFGKDSGAYLTEVTGGSGVAKGDANAYNITFTAEEADNAPEVDSTIVPALLTPAP